MQQSSFFSSVTNFLNTSVKDKTPARIGRENVRENQEKDRKAPLKDEYVGTLNPRSQTLNHPKPFALNPTPYTLTRTDCPSFKPYTLYPTLKRTDWFLLHEPVPNTKPYTLYPTLKRTDWFLLLDDPHSVVPSFDQLRNDIKQIICFLANGDGRTSLGLGL